MTVQELIQELQKVKDKDREVRVDARDVLYSLPDVHEVELFDLEDLVVVTENNDQEIVSIEARSSQWQKRKNGMK